MGSIFERDAKASNALRCTIVPHKGAPSAFEAGERRLLPIARVLSSQH
jgi:hypothetical protein